MLQRLAIALVQVKTSNEYEELPNEIIDSLYQTKEITIAILSFLEKLNMFISC